MPPPEPPRPPHARDPHAARHGARGARAVESLTPLAPRPLNHVLFRQYWRDLLFLHWEADPFEVARLLPSGVVPDLHNGRTYVGLVFFRMEGLALGSTPPLPHLGTFDEVNVRLYSRDALGRRGVVFRSLDCDRLLPVLAARVAFGLPYRWARTSRRWFGDRLVYRTRARAGRRGERPAAHAWADVHDGVAVPGPLDAFLTSRWGLHGSVAGRSYYLPNTHPAWTFRPCTLLDWDASLVGAAGLTPPRQEPASVLYAPGVPVRFGTPTALPPVRHHPAAGHPAP
ncbi:YqjF family protein [Streptomyces sp. NPDC086091]|uniref:YqjF family protein n=1 Tax=Streptomyces sp. NPDC086091 TaxID=3365751 RepID=UPI00381DDC89